MATQTAPPQTLAALSPHGIDQTTRDDGELAVLVIPVVRSFIRVRNPGGKSPQNVVYANQIPDTL